jgi:hypothetical protein
LAVDGAQAVQFEPPRFQYPGEHKPQVLEPDDEEKRPLAHEVQVVLFPRLKVEDPHTEQAVLARTL